MRTKFKLPITLLYGTFYSSHESNNKIPVKTEVKDYDENQEAVYPYGFSSIASLQCVTCFGSQAKNMEYRVHVNRQYL